MNRPTCRTTRPPPASRCKEQNHAHYPRLFFISARSHRRADFPAGAVLPRQGLGGEHRIHRRSASPKQFLGDVGIADVRSPGCRRGVDGAERMPQGLRRPLHQDVGIRLQPWLGVAADVVHRQPAQRRTRLPARAPRGRWPQHPLHHEILCRRSSRRRALRWQMNSPGSAPAFSQDTGESRPMEQVDLRREFDEVGIGEVLDQLDRELIGLKPVKTRIREIASLLLIERIRKRMNLTSDVPTLHMSFTGNPGTGKTTVALRMASILHKLGFVRRGQVVSVTRDELVGQYIGHTAPKTKEILKKAMGGVLFIDEAYYLHRPDNERDYGQEAIEILLQVMESQREDLVVILAGYGDRMDKFFASNPGFRSGMAHHIDFPDYADDELFAIAELMLCDMNYKFTHAAREAFVRYIRLRKAQPLFSNARSIRNALDRMRLRQANRLVTDLDRMLTAEDIMSLEASDVLASRVFLNASNG